MGEYLCPNCGQPIYDDEALLCHFCGESLQRSSSGMLGKVKGNPGKWFLIAISVVVIAAFLILLLR